MRIKRTYGATMREALAQVKAEQGADAVILGNKKVPGGVEILSAIDFDHRQVDAYSGDPAMDLSTHTSVAPKVSPNALPASPPPVEQAVPAMPDFVLDQMQEGRREPVLGVETKSIAQPSPAPQPPVAAVPPPAPETVSAESSTVTAPAPQRKPRPSRGLPVEEEALVRAHEADELLTNLRDKPYRKTPAQPPHQPVIEEVKGELKNLRDLMQSQLSVLEWDRYSQRHPVRSVLLNLMTELGLGSDVCELVFKQLGSLNEDPHKVWQQALGLLARAIPIANNEILEQGGRYALVGSTGVGKTTTIAKLAARYAHSHGKRSVALISTDNFRIGAQEQLQHFARMLEIPLLEANTSEELTDRLKMLADKQLVLIDTAGMSQNDVRLSEQFHKLQHGSPEIKPYLVVSANTQLAALNETVKNFARVKLAGAIVTKLDESASLGGVITAAVRYQLPLAYCSNGQRVPEDLQLAKTHRLVSKAVSLMQNFTEHHDKETLAFRYSHLISGKNS